MPEKVTCQSCHTPNLSRDSVQRCFVCGRDVCFTCGSQRMVKATGRMVRVCSHCIMVPEDRLR